MNLVPNKQLLLNIPFESTKDRKKEFFVDNNVQETTGDVYCLTCRNEKCVDLSTKRWLVSTRVKSAKPAATFWIFLLRTKNRHLCCLVVMVHIALQERRVAITKKKNLVHFEEISPPITVTRTKKGRNECKYGINVSVFYWLMIWATYSNFKPFCLVAIYCQPLKLNQLTVNLQKVMIFSVSNDGIQWILDFGPHSVGITVKDLDQNTTISSKKYP